MLSVCQIMHMFLHENMSRVLICSTRESKGIQYTAHLRGFAVKLGKIKSTEENYYLPELHIKRAHLVNRDQ